MEVWFVRHAKTIANHFRVGHNPHNDKLSPKGILQALATGKRLARESFDEVYVSDLNRTKETLENMVHTHPKIQELDLIYTSLIREQERGSDWNLTFDALKQKIKDSAVDPRAFRSANGESCEDVNLRAEKFLKFLTYKHLIELNQLNAKDSNLVKELLMNHLENEKDMTSGEKISKKEFEDYSSEEQKAISKYLEKESRNNRRWLWSPHSENTEVPAVPKAKPRRNDTSRAQANDLKKVLVLSHAGFIREILNITKKNMEQQHQIRNCSITVVSISCKETSGKCNGSCLSDSIQGISNCIEYEVNRNYDDSHTAHLKYC